MKFNVKPSDCRFVVNKDKKTIVCIYEGCTREFIDFINDNCELTVLNGLWGNESQARLYNKMFMPNRFVGIATCSPDDEWDEKTGRLIAFSRMKNKLNRSFFKRANTFFNTVDKWLDEAAELINKVGEKLEVNQERRHEYIENLISHKE